uniref:CCHC-type domain-containing protein n=1 Tax=Strongyloides venezuelensis TaxID=75913 RepID=A0A0K0FT12_STRVS
MKVHKFMDGKNEEFKNSYTRAKSLALTRFESENREDEIGKLVNFKIISSDSKQLNRDAQKFQNLIEKAHGDVRKRKFLHRLWGMLRGDLQTIFFTYIVSIDSYDKIVSNLFQYININGLLNEMKFKSTNRNMLMKKKDDKDDECCIVKKKCYQCRKIGHIKPLCLQLKAKNNVKIVERTCKASEDDKDKRIGD